MDNEYVLVYTPYITRKEVRTTASQSKGEKEEEFYS